MYSQLPTKMAFSRKLKESEKENIYQLGLKEILSISSTCSEKGNSNVTTELFVKLKLELVGI